MLAIRAHCRHPGLHYSSGVWQPDCPWPARKRSSSALPLPSGTVQRGRDLIHRLSCYFILARPCTLVTQKRWRDFVMWVWYPNFG